MINGAADLALLTRVRDGERVVVREHDGGGGYGRAQVVVIVRGRPPPWRHRKGRYRGIVTVEDLRACFKMVSRKLTLSRGFEM